MQAAGGFGKELKCGRQAGSVTGPDAGDKQAGKQNKTLNINV